MRQTAMKHASAIDSWFVSYGCVVEGLAQDIEAIGPGNRGVVETLVRHKVNAYIPEVLDFYVGFKDGTIASGIGWIPGSNYDCRSREWYLRAVAADKVVFTEPYIDAQTGRMVITIAKRVSSDSTLGDVVAADIFLTKIVDVVDRYDMAGAKYAFLLNAAGDVLAHPDKTLLPGSAGMKNISSLGRRDYADLGSAVKASKLGLIEARDAWGGRAYFMLSSIPSCGWLFGVSIDPAEYKRPLDSLLYGFLVALAISALAGVFVMQRLMTGMLEPIRALSEAVRSFSVSNMDARAAVDSEDELGELAASFNSMADTIRDYSRSLEQKVEERTLALKERNDKITESIAYAERIQRASLPDIVSCLGLPEGDAFVVFKPRDVVGGDCYWCRREGSQLLLALADCTGHGVPGALMTMALASILGGAPSELPSRGPSALVAYAHERLRMMLGQGGTASATDDGADLAVVSVDLRTRRLSYCGAHMPLFEESGGVAKVHPGGRFSVGYSRSDAASFEDEAVALAPGSVFYLTTDGLLDQDDKSGRGGIGRSGFAELVASQGGLSMREREAGLEAAIEEKLAWRGQRDDIAILCFTIR